MHITNRSALLLPAILWLLTTVCWSADIWKTDKTTEYVIDNQKVIQRMIGLEGKIERGDYNKIYKLFQAETIVTEIYLYSLGGDVSEAIKISNPLNENLVWVTAPNDLPVETQWGSRIPDGMRPRDEANHVCVSACALIWLGSRRKGGSEIYVHRPKFEHQYFSAMETSKAQKMYSKLLLRVRRFLEDRKVPLETILKIESVLSSEVEKLDSRWYELLSGEDAFLSERMHANCQKFDGGKVAKYKRAQEKTWKLVYSVEDLVKTVKDIPRHEADLKEAKANEEYWWRQLIEYYSCSRRAYFVTLYEIQSRF